MLACAEMGMTLDDYVTRLAPYIAHLHIADASGLDCEGQQIGQGEINFAALARLLDRLVPDAGFIPEIWQGHVDDGQGFWAALELLEPVFQGSGAPGQQPSARTIARHPRSLRETRGARSRSQ
jgi:N-acetylneuraminate synthase